MAAAKGTTSHDTGGSKDIRLLRAVVAQSADAIHVKDLSGRYIFVNPQAARLVGFSELEIIGKDATQIFPADQARQIVNTDTRVMETGAAMSEEVEVTLEGRRVVMLSRKVPLRDTAGSVIGVIGVSRDITDWRDARDQLEDHRRELEELVLARTAELEKANEKLRNEIAEHHRAERERLASDARYYGLFDAVPVGLYRTEPDGRILDANPAMVFMLGYPDRESLLAANMADIYVDASDRRRQRETLRQKGTVLAFETKWRRADGRTILVRDSTREVRDKQGGVRWYDGSVEDVTDRRKTEERYRMLFSEMGDGFAYHEMVCADDGTPRDYRFLEVNPAFEAMTGLNADDIVGRLATEVLPNLEHEWIEIYGEIAMTGKVKHLTRYSRSLDRHYEVTAFSPAPGQFATIFRDVTERIRIEKERHDLEGRVQHAQKMESLGLLAGGIAHDFNNILTGILGNAGLAIDEAPAGSALQQTAREIERAAKRAAELARQMLAYSGKGRFIIDQIDINDVIRDMVDLLKASIGSKVHLDCRFEDDLPAVEVDVTQIRQVLMNLITNASEAISDVGSVRLITSRRFCATEDLRETTVSDLPSPGEYVCVEVSDTGHGMDKETAARMFDPFFSTKFTGRGLGLAAVLGIVRGHKGAVKVYSEPGKGTSIKVFLPASDKEAAARAREPSDSGKWRGSGTVLVADDDETLLRVASRMLEKVGFDVVTARDGMEAVEVFRKQGREVVCVLLDLTMPHMDGEQVFHELRSLKSDLPIVLSSGYNEQDVVNRFSSSGLAGFIQKPYQHGDLIRVLRKALQ